MHVPAFPWSLPAKTPPHLVGQPTTSAAALPSNVVAWGDPRLVVCRGGVDQCAILEGGLVPGIGSVLSADLDSNCGLGFPRLQLLLFELYGIAVVS
jgi:hypothetical protein